MGYSGHFNKPSNLLPKVQAHIKDYSYCAKLSSCIWGISGLMETIGGITDMKNLSQAAKEKKKKAAKQLRNNNRDFKPRDSEMYSKA